MKFEVFEKIINKIKSCSEKDNQIYKLGVDITSIIDDYNRIINLLLRSYYSEEGSEWIDWFLYDRETLSGEILKAYDKNGNEVCKNLKELWIMVEEIRCSIDFKEYQLKPEMSDEERLKIIENLFKK